MILLAGAALALSACGGGNDTAANDANGFGTDNMMMDPNMLDANSGMTGMEGMNGMDAMNGVGANGSVDAGTANMMANDAATNDPDTNLANGL
jgi:hypothetical protein